MRRNKAFPGPGDRVRLAIPQPNDESGLLVRYGTVIEKSIGRSSALKVRWDDTAGRSGFAADGGTEGWLADAAWYWDRAQLRVVHGDEADEVAAPVPVAARRAPAAPEEDGWLTAAPQTGGSAGRDGSRDAMAEWEAALASELEMGPDGDWEQLLARALHHGASSTPARQPAAPARPTPPPAPAAPPAPSRPATQAEARPTPPPAAAAEPVAPPAPPKPVQPWTGDDIIPRSGGKRRGRR